MIRRKPRRDPVTPSLRDYILDRDRVCVLARIDPDHMCRDAFGTPHNPEAFRAYLAKVNEEAA